MSILQLPKTGSRVAAVMAAALLLAACAEPVVEQTRRSHENSSGRTLPLSYEVASDWEVGRRGNYYLPGVEHNKARLSINMSPAKHMKESLPDKLDRITRRGQSDKDRHVLTTRMTTVNGLEALEYAEQGEAYKPPQDRYFRHDIEFISGPHLIEASVRGHSSYYPVLLKQLEHTVNSVQVAAE